MKKTKLLILTIIFGLIQIHSYGLNIKKSYALTKGLTSDNEMLPNFISFNSDTKKFKFYQRDFDNENIFIMFEVDLNSSRGLSTDEIQYVHIWVTRSGKRCTYDPINETMLEHESLLVNGESECTFYYSGITGSKIDHTGGIHGDEAIDIYTDSFVSFFIDGQKLIFFNSFELLACETFKYIQRSSLHETAEKTKNKDTGIIASGDGILDIDNNNFTIDGINTEIIAYSQSGFIDAITDETLSISSSNTWMISNVVEIIPNHPKIGTHIKETIFENLGYRTINTLTMDARRNFIHWYSGICSIHKNVAKIGYSNDSIQTSFTGTNNNVLNSYSNRFLYAYNPTTYLSCEIESRIIEAGTYIKDTINKTADIGGNILSTEGTNFFIWDRENDSKYYRKQNDFTSIAGESFTSEMTVKIGYNELNNLSIDNHQLTRNNFAIWPNPFQNEFSISTDYIKDSNIKIELYSISGKLVQEYNLLNHSGDIIIQRNALIPGVYFCKIIIDDKYIITDKLLAR